MTMGLNMSKGNWVIVILGLAGCLALSLSMRHVLNVRQQVQVDPIIRDLTEIFGERLRGASEFAVEQRGEQAVGVLTIRPRLQGPSRRLALSIGNFIWREYGQSGRFRALEVIVCGRQGDPSHRFPIPRLASK
jgi:hypothetical protein